MAEEKKNSAAKQRIIDNYKKQRQQYRDNGYTEKEETISVLKANIMALAAAGPFIIISVLTWLLITRHGEISGSLFGSIWFLLFFLATIFIHELLHGVGWFFWTAGKWKSIYIGIMWESMTPYCHCKEALKPKQYLVGALTPFLVLGIGVYVAALLTGNYTFFFLAVLNMLGAGGDLTIAWMALKYLRQNDYCYILDHPTDCGFVAFERR